MTCGNQFTLTGSVGGKIIRAIRKSRKGASQGRRIRQCVAAMFVPFRTGVMIEAIGLGVVDN